MTRSGETTEGTRTMDNYTVRFEGILKTESPFACSPPEHEHPKLKYKMLPRMTVHVGGFFQELPMINASTIRGSLRRAACSVVLERFRAVGQQATLEDYLLWSIGGVKGSGKEELDLSSRSSIIRNSAILATFGAGASPAGGMVGGRFMVGAAIPTEIFPVTVINGARSAENRNPDLADLIGIAGMEQAQEYTRANTQRAALTREVKQQQSALWKAEKALKEKTGKRPTTEEDVASLKEKLDASKALLAAAGEEAKEAVSDNSIGMPLAGYEVIPPGIEFPHLMEVKAVSSLHVGFIVDALSEFAVDPILGAHCSTGCGNVSARYSVKVRKNRERMLTDDGIFSFGKGEGAGFDGQFLAECLNEWEEHEFVPDHYRA